MRNITDLYEAVQSECARCTEVFAEIAERQRREIEADKPEWLKRLVIAHD